jgi:hypothetical protein
MVDIGKAKQNIERNERLNRRKRLFQILRDISTGKVDSSKKLLEPIFNQNGPRQTYISPKDRGTYNSGGMQSSEFLAGNPFGE